MSDNEWISQSADANSQLWYCLRIL